MRPFKQFEQGNIKFLVNHQVQFTLVQITATALKKSILDATAPVRSYFLEQMIHNYSEQLQGSAHKQLVPTKILDAHNVYQTQSSLYRPNNKNGDPRLWIYKLGAYTYANDIHAIWVFNREFIVINITRINLAKSFNAPIASPLRDFIREFQPQASVAAMELLHFFRQHKGKCFEAEVSADTGIGPTIESMLGILPNSKQSPDHKGIELKSHRAKRSSSKRVLFTQSPDWTLSKLKSGREIVAKYGYLDSNTGKKQYHNTVQCGRANSQGLGLHLNQLQELLELQYYGAKLDKVAVWSLLKLHARLRAKHRETFWITVDNEYVDGKEYFRYRSIEHSRSPVLAQFDVLLETAMITVDLLLSHPHGHGDAYSFKIKQKGMPLLFPENITYSIL